MEEDTKVKKVKLLYDLHDKPPIWQWIILSLQHVFAMFGATVLVPILVNAGIAAAGVEGQALSIAVALVTAGLGTLIYIACTRAKSPVFLGSSFAFISPIIAAYIAGAGNDGGVSGGIAGAMTGVMVVGVVYLIVALIIKFAGKKWIDKLLPPIVIGPMIMIIGLGLASSAVGNIFDTSIAAEGIEWKGPVVALITFLITALFMTRAKGFFKIIPFLMGIIAGYIAACAFGLVNFQAVIDAPWFQLPQFYIPFANYQPNWAIALTMAPIALVTMAEHIGDHKALSTIIGKDLIKDPGLDKTLMGDGLATFFAGFLGGPANTTYGENTSVVGMTKNASVWVIGLAAIFAIVLGFLGKFTALVQTIPNPVLGGVSLLLYGFIAVNGLKVLIQNNIDFSKNKNIIVASAMLVLGLGGAAFTINTGNGLAVSISGMSLAAIAGIILNLIIPNDKDDEEIEKNEDIETSDSEKESEDEDIETEEIDEKTEEEDENESEEEIEEDTEDEVEEKAEDEDKEATKAKMEKIDIPSNVIEVNHPLIEHKIGILRDKNTGTKEFREIAGEIGEFLCYKAMEDAELEAVEIETPIEKTEVKRLQEKNYVFVPILRAGLGMMEGVIKAIPNAKIGHIGMYRDDEDPEHKPIEYYFKVPSGIENKEVVILDPMLATGGSAIDAIEALKNKGVKKIKFICMIAAPEGLKAVSEKYPEVPIYCAKVDDHLNDDAYIVPGLGDAGDRIFGTK